MWYDDTELLTPVTDAELTPKTFVRLFKEGMMKFNIDVMQILPYPPAYYANISYLLGDEWDTYRYVFNPGREVWVRLSV